MFFRMLLHRENKALLHLNYHDDYLVQAVSATWREQLRVDEIHSNLKWLQFSEKKKTRFVT